MSTDPTEPLTINEEVYRDHRKTLIELGNDQLRTFDRAILGLSSGAFGLSILFLREVIGEEDVQGVDWLLYAWGGFSAAIVINVVSYMLSWKDSQIERMKLDRCFSEGKPYDPTGNPYRLLTVWGNTVALLVFILSILGLAIFVVLNVKS